MREDLGNHRGSSIAAIILKAPPQCGERSISTDYSEHTPFLIACLGNKKRPRKLRGRFSWLPELGSNQRPAD
jgi:hypothetical protein